MIKEIVLSIHPKHIHSSEYLRSAAAKECGITEQGISEIRISKRSIDARNKSIRYIVTATIYIGEFPEQEENLLSSYKKINSNKSVLIIGAGPCGYFAALELLRYGVKPIVLDRGKDVRSRRKDLRDIQQFGKVNPHSNYCFGEGGAGTYSDGKLYTSSKKRGDIRYILRLLTEHGANPDILVDTHPHIGSNKLPGVVQSLRETICEYGGEVHFNSYVTDITISNNKFVSCTTDDGKQFAAGDCIIATGHSSRDIFRLLASKNIALEAKPFALGVRAEHPQEIIDEIQYHGFKRGDFLPASSYKLVTHVGKRGVFSFCMCPGGLIVPAATAPGEIVVNGMSMSRRDSEYANSGIVVSVNPVDTGQFSDDGIFSCLHFQEDVEKKVWKNSGNGTQTAPAQKITDFVQKKKSAELPNTSYIPGIYSAELETILPTDISLALQKAFIDFEKKMKGYLTEEAIIVATESRTSSPIKIPRDKEKLHHVEVDNLYPAGEGAGYAGGIMSAALDGKAIAERIAQKYSLV